MYCVCVCVCAYAKSIKIKLINNKCGHVFNGPKKCKGVIAHI